MLHNERLTRTFVVLGILCAFVYLGEFLWGIAHTLSDLILILAMAWMVAYVLHPIAQWLDQGLVPQPVLGWVNQRWGERPASRLGMIRMPYALAAVLLYVLLLLSLVLMTVLLAPGIVKQLSQLANQVPEYIQQIPAWWEGVQDQVVQRFDVDRETLAEVIPVEEVTREATAVLPDVIDNAIALVQGIATGIANTLLVLILSLYIMLDGKRLSEQFYRLVPLRYQDEFQFVFNTIDRTFGGFLRGQVLMALIQGIFTGVVMRLFGLQFTVLTAVSSGVLMFIPEVGAPVAMVAPSVASALQDSNATLLLFVIMLIFQQILIRFIIPHVMSEAIGMPPLLILVSVLVSVKVIGLWGFIFGIPVAGAVYITITVTLERAKQAVDAQDRQRQAEQETGL